MAVVRAWVSGTGSLGQVVDALARVQAQPWAHRVEGFSIQPIDAPEDRFKVRVDLATIRMTALRPGIEDGADLAEPDEATRLAAGRVVSARPFGFAPPAPAPAPEAEPAGPAFGRWRVTGLIEGARVEALLLDVVSGERRVLAPGQGVLGAVFDGGSGEIARFTVDGHAHRVRVGQTLADRRRAGSEHGTERVSAREESP